VFCKNVLEYVDSAADTVVEMARVTAPGGIVVASDSDWDLLVLETGAANRELNERVLAAAKSIAVKEPRIGRMLFGMFRDAGLADVKVNIIAGADTVGRSLTMFKASFARYAHDSGHVTEAESAAWLASVERAVKEGNFFFVLPQFVVRGAKK
jgi:SAM-dependent methyltransferase